MRTSLLLLLLLTSPAIAEDYFGSILIFDADHFPASDEVKTQGRAIVSVVAGPAKKFKFELTIFRVGTLPGPNTLATKPQTVGPLSPIIETSIPGGGAGGVIKASLPDNPGTYLAAGTLDVGHLDAMGQVTAWVPVAPTGFKVVTVP